MCVYSICDEVLYIILSVQFVKLYSSPDRLIDAEEATRADFHLLSNVFPTSDIQYILVSHRIDASWYDKYSGTCDTDTMLPC